MKNFSDIIIIGAGPAGLSAAVTASNLGLDVLVLDEQPSLGGQIYRNIERAGKQERKILGADYEKGRLLIEKFKESRAEYIGNAIVWRIDLDGNVCFSHENKSRQINGKHIIIATGAMERPVPFPGWTLPGVMGAGAVDANFKSSGMIPDGPVVLAGSGPLLLLSAGHLMDLGVNIHAILDTTPIQNYVAAAPHLPRALKRLDTLFKGLGMLMNIKRSKVPVYKGVTQYMAQGRDCLKRISFKTKSRTRQMDAGMLLVQEGVIPRCDFTRQLGLKHLWNPVQRYFYPGTNVFGKSQVDTIYVAGDGAFVHGGIPSALKGSLAALDIAEKLNALPQAQKATQIAKQNKKLQAELCPRPFVDTLYQPRPNLYDINDETIVCRCEEVKAKDIRQAILDGCRDPNEIKAMTRCGMGQCQSRMCSIALNEIMARHLDLASDMLGHLNIRPPVRNVSLSQMARINLLENEPL